ncbi:MAG TPA: hypothetical protein PLF50_07385 [Candidatus Cloacimonadota bacterium]|nr:hypothetical protein [Candidatus Cloacimonadota bacterium]HOV17295.1 hypothetical protein [Candidatus Cloacimonadota bacterium]HQL15611.1 hypothetical protein [Candidatus Cloacimonadota bacterium]
MKIHFRDVQTGMVEARAVIEIDEGVFLNEVTILNIDNQLVVEFPRKNFVGKNDRTHYLDIVTFEDEDKRILWELQIKQAYREWRKQNRKVLVYEDKVPEEDTSEKKHRPGRKDISGSEKDNHKHFHRDEQHNQRNRHYDNKSSSYRHSSDYKHDSYKASSSDKRDKHAKTRPSKSYNKKPN